MCVNFYTSIHYISICLVCVDKDSVIEDPPLKIDVTTEVVPPISLKEVRNVRQSRSL